MSLRPRNEHLLESLTPFLVARVENRARFELRPFDLVFEDVHCFDPLRTDAARFLDLLCHLDVVAFGAHGMAMPRWIFFDGGELSGGIVGFGRRALALTHEARALLHVPDGYRGLVPLSMFIAIPTFDRSTWVGHNLASLAGRVAGEDLRGLGGLTKAVALKTFRSRSQIGVAQWNNVAMHVHTRMGPLRVLTAWTPAHTKPWTVTYRADVDDAALRHLARDPEGALRHLARDPEGRIATPATELWLDSRDHSAMRALQQRIESGERFHIVGRPEPLEGGGQRLPLGGES
ncbi:MAG: hypothetical protein JRH16_21760 [Deltaproteobacteria bacterium]|nr:hypothetical protein [Deltaproteobacteria bacterium]